MQSRIELVLLPLLLNDVCLVPQPLEDIAFVWRRH